MQLAFTTVCGGTPQKGYGLCLMFLKGDAHPLL